MYQIEFTRAATWALAALPHRERERVAQLIDSLAREPRPAGARALRGEPGLLRVRVGDYRVIYTIDDDRLVVLIVGIGHRREVYRRLR